MMKVGALKGERIEIPLSTSPVALEHLPSDYRNELPPEFLERMRRWQQSQMPVSKLRYPRAVAENKNKKNRGGHVWFGRHANPNKSKSGLERFYLDRELEKRHDADAVRGQPLPHFDPDQPLADVLFGYDMFVGDSPEWKIGQKGGMTIHKKFEPFDPHKHARGGDGSGGNQGQNRSTRQGGRRNRSR